MSNDSFLTGKYNSVCPVDSRYRLKLKSVRDIFSYLNWYKKACKFEIEWLIFLQEFKVLHLPKLSEDDIDDLKSIYECFTISDMERVEKIEETTNHDIKALEYYIKEKLQEVNFHKEYLPYIHYCLTSNDTVITTNYLLFIDYYDLFRDGIIKDILEITGSFDPENTIFIARTHGQQALPTTFHKEIYKYRYRLESVLELMDKIPLKTKLSGAIGSYASFTNFLEPDGSRLMGLLQRFIKEISLESERKNNLSLDWYTTQTNNYYTLCLHLNFMKDLSNIMIDLCKDLWLYISHDYLSLKKKENEVGSSTMVQKVNPIDLENAEGNFEIFSNWVEFITRKLSQSRMQRDLSDSTVIRNLGTMISHFHLGMQSIIRGLNKILVNKVIVDEETNNSWQVMTEYLQLYLKNNGLDNGYEIIKNYTRGLKSMTQREYKDLVEILVEKLDISTDDYEKLLSITMQNYI
jgi:adenylosuccinate lyase